MGKGNPKVFPGKNRPLIKNERLAFGSLGKREMGCNSAVKTLERRNKRRPNLVGKVNGKGTIRLSKSNMGVEGKKRPTGKGAGETHSGREVSEL